MDLQVKSSFNQFKPGLPETAGGARVGGYVGPAFLSGDNVRDGSFFPVGFRLASGPAQCPVREEFPTGKND